MIQLWGGSILVVTFNFDYSGPVQPSGYYLHASIGQERLGGLFDDVVEATQEISIPEQGWGTVFLDVDLYIKNVGLIGISPGIYDLMGEIMRRRTLLPDVIVPSEYGGGMRVVIPQVIEIKETVTPPPLESKFQNLRISYKVTK